MKSLDTLIRLKRFQAEEKRRHLVQIETMIAEFDRMSRDLEREIEAEEQRSGITDTQHFAYSTYARAAATRRDNMRRSADELKGQLSEARLAHDDALDELKKVEALGERERVETPVDMSPRNVAGRARVVLGA
ncbi:flagellar export protein FliJ [Ancylobacter dichloromethanicus]|uniref:Flagellar export protein FliJ n=1 Tax=Ancylobacter dichloromethanicus TaxID=518825 RepID=A0A9W6JB94_9HYPH|nr:flagellar export protein FliJ [Ancylobacter dichloromethanicus]MBS7553617.1 flagellar export protein FliJ [Ancylobacter dichloromethanicus]GLK72680.1 flagellar export protein FliJ [Ancylobacter dichloromethanicus]